MQLSCCSRNSGLTMTSLYNVPREILDSMRDVLDRRIKLSIKRLVNYETKKDKTEQRVLAFSTYRVFVFLAKTPAKIETSFHYLELKSIESKKPNHLVINVANKSYTFTTLEPETDEVNHMITHIGTSLKTIFPAYPLERLIKKIEVQPSDRLRVMHDMNKTIESKETGPCGGFTHMYACMCDKHGLTYRDEVAWDVDTIYLSQDSRVLCLRDFDHLKERDLVPIVAALTHNTWFTTLNANNVKLVPEVCTEILNVMTNNSVMEALLLSNTGITTDFIKKLSTVSMSDTQLHKLDLSNNNIDDIAAEHIFGSLSSRGKMFTYIDLSRTKVTSRGLNKVAEAMNRSPQVFSSLQTLKLTNLASPKAGEDLQGMYSFLASPNMISDLDLSGTDLELDKLVSPLQRGCSHIVSLNLSRMAFTSKRSKEVLVPASFKQFFSTVYTLKHLDLSGAKLPPEAVKELLLGIGSNRNLKNVHLDISSIDLQTQGAQNLQNCLTQMSTISSLNISNIGFSDIDLCNVLNCIGGNKAIKHLSMGKVFTNIKPRNIKNVMDALVHILQDDDSVIESLSLADSKLKDSMNMIINALGGNMSLTEIDISGNLMGDLGARMLSKALQINNKLKTILWDKNNTGCQGFEDIAEALEKNYTLKKMPLPVYDASVALRSQPERTEQTLQTIESLLQRNHSPQKYSSDQAYRLQQGFLISSTQQMVDRLVVQSQDTVNALTMDNLDTYSGDVEKARSIIKDADNSKILLPKLHDIAIQSQTSGSPVEKKLKEIAADLKQVLEQQMQKTVSDMLAATNKRCKAIMGDESFVSELRTGCVEKSAFPKDFTSNILDGVDTDIFNKLSELNLAVAAHVSDQVIDEVIERLSKTHKTLTNHLNQKKKDVARKSQTKSQKMEDDEANRRTKGTESPHDSGDFLRIPKSDSPKMQSKRKSMHARKIRPQSVVDRDHVQVALNAAASRERPVTVPQAKKRQGSRSPRPTKPVKDPSKAGQKEDNKPTKLAKSPKKSKAPKSPGGRKSSESPATRKSSGATEPIPQIEVTFDNDLDPVYDNAVAVGDQVYTGGRPRRPSRSKDGLDAEPTLSLPQKPSPTPSKDLVESLDVVPDLQTQKLQHVTKERPRRAKNIRPTTRQSNLPTTSDENVKVDEDVEQFFATPVVTPSTPTSNGPSKVEEKTSSAKSTPESKKKGMGIFGFGNKDKENSNKDQKKKTGGLFNRNKSPKNTPSPTNRSKGSRVSDVVEEPDDEPSNNSPEARRSRLDNTSLSSSKSGSKSSIRSEGSSIGTVSDKDKNVEKDDTSLSDKSSKSSESDTENENLNSNSNNETIDKKDEDSAKPVQEKKALAPPTKKVIDKPVELRNSQTDGEGDTDKGNDIKDVKEVIEGKEGEQKKGSDDEKDVKEDKADSSTKEEESTTEKEEPSTDKEGPSKDKEEPSKDKEEPTKEKEESEKEEAETASPKPTVKKPKGIGFGVNIMAEMKKKQEKRQSMLPGGKPASVDKPATPNTSSVSEEKKSPFGLKSLKPVSAKPKPDIDTKPTTTAKPADNISSDSSKTESVSPTPDKKSMFGDRVKRSSSGRVVDEDKKTPVKESEAGDTSSKPVVTPRPSLPNSKPPPPTRPKPPGKPTPVPRKSVGGETDEPVPDTKPVLPTSPKPDDKPIESGIVYDSATLKLSVKDKLSKFQNKNNPNPLSQSDKSESRSSKEFNPPEKKKDNSLPRGITPSDMKKSSSLTRDVTSGDLKGDKTACELDLKTESNSDMTDSGIDFDHDTPTSSVRDVTARFGNGDVTDKAGSLPRNTKPSDLFKDSDTGSKRPKSMFAVVESRPDLKTRESLTRDRVSKKIAEEPSDSATKTEDKEEKKSSADEIIMV